MTTATLPTRSSKNPSVPTTDMKATNSGVCPCRGRPQVDLLLRKSKIVREGERALSIRDQEDRGRRWADENGTERPGRVAHAMSGRVRCAGCGGSNGGIQATDLGEAHDKPVYRTRIEFYCGIAMFGGKGAARLTNVLNG